MGNTFHKDLTGADLHAPKDGTSPTFADLTVTSLKIQDGGTIGSVSVPNVVTIDASGNMTFSIFPITPSAEPDADYEVANMKYVNDKMLTIDTDYHCLIGSE